MRLHRIEFYIERLAHRSRVIMIAEQPDGTRTPHADDDTRMSYEECMETIEQIATRFLADE
jgi:hypothetical protein